MAETEESNIFCIGDKYFIYVCEYIWGNVLLFRCMSNCFDVCRIVSMPVVLSRLVMFRCISSFDGLHLIVF